MSRESVEQKARRYAVEARLIVEAVDARRIAASCRGNGEVYQLGYSNGGWFCSCPCLTRCAHIAALQLVCVAPVLRRMEAAAS